MESLSEFLSSFLPRIEEVKIPQRNFFEICGISKKELVSSNVLAFFFDENETHAMSRLFLDSLLQLCREHIEHLDDSVFLTPFGVQREFQNIDLLLSSPEQEPSQSNEVLDWAIIIENKVYASLYNDLDKYWRSVQAKEKIGIVLSLEREPLSSTNFVNILYRDFSNRIKQNMAVHFEEADTAGLILLREYLANINALSMSSINDPSQINNLILYQKEHAKIEELYAFERKVQDFAVRNVLAAFKELGFSPKSESTNTWTKHFFPDQELHPEAEGLRFFVDFYELIARNKLSVHFESYGDWSAAGDAVRKQFIDMLPQGVSLGEGGGPTSQYCHLFCLNTELPQLTPAIDLKITIKTTLSIAFFESNLFTIAVERLRHLRDTSV